MNVINLILHDDKVLFFHCLQLDRCESGKVFHGYKCLKCTYNQEKHIFGLLVRF